MTVPPGYDPSDYPSFAVTADVAVFTLRDDRLQVVLVERGADPFKGMWALPGGFVEIGEDLADAAARELEEETGIAGIGLNQLGAYGKPDRDPRMRVVTVAYWSFAPDLPDPTSGSDAAEAILVPVDEALSDPGSFAADHHLILGDAVRNLRRQPGMAGG